MAHSGPGISKGGDITGVTAGVGLSGGGDSSGVTLTLDLSELSAVVPTSGDWFGTLDSDGANEQLTTTDALATLFAGTGLTAASAVIGVDASQTQITAVGTIATGTWEGTTVAVDQGGTGATSLTNLITLATHTTGDYVQNITAGTGLTSTGATSGENIAHSLSVDASQTQITGVGTITTGTWTGTAVASAYLDADTAHLSTTQTFSGAKTFSSSVDHTLDAHFDSSPADETVSGITATFTAGETLVRGEVVYFKAGDSKMWKAVATAAGTMPVAAMAAADISADATGKFLLYGFLADNGTFPAYTVGGDLYAPEAETVSQNVPEQTAPDTDGDFVQLLGYAVTANSVFFNPDQTVIEHA